MERSVHVVVDRFLAGMKLGRPPEELREEALPGGSEDRLYDLFCLQGIPKHLQSLSIGGGQRLDLYYSKDGRRVDDPSVWQANFAFGLRQAVQSAIDVAAGRLATISTPASAQSAAQRARAWFISS